MKKLVWRLSLPIFLFTIITPLFVMINTVDSTDNRVHCYLYTVVHMVCPDGSVIGSYDEWRSISWTDSDHPPDTLFCWGEGFNIQCRFFHTHHAITRTVHPSVTHTNIYMTERSCR